MSESQNLATPYEGMSFTQFQNLFTGLTGAIGKIVQGKEPAVELSLICVLAEGHLLIEDVPGVGKTTLARCVAAAFGGEYKRIQFTPDLLPSDITGVTVFDQSTRQAEFRKGPVFANVVVADEINRASPKTQSALLEVMEEGQVTTGGTALPVPFPFFVVATQNPVDMEGTYSLPEAQLDRFLMRVRIGYPDAATERTLVTAGSVRTGAADLAQIIDAAQFRSMAATARQVKCSADLADYAVQVAAATRDHAGLRLGASPRGSIALIRAARVRAASQGRGTVHPDDVQLLVHPVLEHRLLPTVEQELSGVSVAQMLRDIVKAFPVPRDRFGGS